MILGCWTTSDSLISALAPLGLAATCRARAALVVDAEAESHWYRSPSTLAHLVEDGPRRADLIPPRPGVALLANGGVGAGDAEPLITALGQGWPAVIVRHAPGGEHPVRPWPIVPVVPVLPSHPVPAGRFVAQLTGLAPAPSGASVVLPRPTRRTVAGLFAGRTVRVSRWLRAMAAVWKVPWEAAA